LPKSLLLISQRPDDRAFAAEVAITAGLSLLTTNNAKEGAEIIAQEQDIVTLADTSSELHYKALEDALRETVGLFSDKTNANSIHFLSSNDLEQVEYLIRSPLFGHFIMRNYGDPRGAGQHYGRILKATLSEKTFGLNTILPNAKIQVVKLKHSSQKQSAVEAVKNYLLAAKFQTRMATTIANAVDELLMNAIFDAPVDELGKSLLSSTPRTAQFDLADRNTVEMHIGFDGTYVGVTAVDSFGSLDKAKLLSHISKVYIKDEFKIKSAVAGSGIGLATVFRMGGSFLFVSESTVRTAVTVFFKRTESFRTFKDQFRFLSTQFYF
jgi:hypothetical protein